MTGQSFPRGSAPGQFQIPHDEVRVRDDERRHVDQRLQVAVGDGSLGLLEYDERARAVWVARTRGELAAVVADLPAAPTRDVPSGAAGSAVRTARSAPWQAVRRLGAAAVVAAFLAASVMHADTAQIILRDIVRG